ncbi:MAG: DUF5655 domain-containing protein [Bacteroidota bacterium]
MWTCPRCERRFKTRNQSHMCVTKTLDELFENKPDHLLLAFDRLLTSVIDWEMNTVGASVNTVIFTNKKAWLIVRPMSKELDLKFYYHEPIESDRFKKITHYNKKYAHHIRVREEEEITSEVLELLRMGFDYAMQ